jgi:hypothetical protein
MKALVNTYCAGDICNMDIPPQKLQAFANNYYIIRF